MCEVISYNQKINKSAQASVLRHCNQRSKSDENSNSFLQSFKKKLRLKQNIRIQILKYTKHKITLYIKTSPIFIILALKSIEFILPLLNGVGFTLPDTTLTFWITDCMTLCLVFRRAKLFVQVKIAYRTRD